MDGDRILHFEIFKVLELVYRSLISEAVFVNHITNQDIADLALAGKGFILLLIWVNFIKYLILCLGKVYCTWNIKHVFDCWGTRSQVQP